MAFGSNTFGGSNTTFGGSSKTSERGSLIDTVTSLYDTIAAQFQPGGSYTKGIEAQLARRKKGAMASGMQSLVSSGMAGTTQAAGLGKKFEEEVGMPTMAAAETDRVSKLTGALMGKAGFMQQLLGSTPERTMTRTVAKSKLPSLYDKSTPGSKKTTMKPAATTHTGRRMFQPFGGSGYGATTGIGNVGSVNSFFAG